MSKRKRLSTEFNEQISLAVSDKFEGVYLEARTVPVDGQARLIYTFKTNDGKEIDMWGSGQLNQYFNKIKPQTKVYIERTEDIPAPNFKNTMMKTYIVEVDA
jgi:hypothetical protein